MNDHPMVDAPLEDDSYRQALSAFIDNELPLDDCAALIDRVASDPSAAARISSYRAQKSALKVLFALDEKAVFPVLIPRRPSWLGRAGIAASWTACGQALGLEEGWRRKGPVEHQGVASTEDLGYAVDAPEQRPVDVVPIADELHLLASFSKRLDKTLVVPSLRQSGY